MGWFKSKKETSEESTRLQNLKIFLSEYNNSDQKEKYAMTLWGHSHSLDKIFGNFDEFQLSHEDRKAKFIQILMTSAVNNLKNKDIISAACDKFYVDYLLATNGKNKNKLSGSIEQISDMLDGIIRYGAKRAQEIGSMEEEINDFLLNESIFKIGSGAVKGPLTERTSGEISDIILRDLQNILKTREDYYWFMIEQHDLLIEEPHKIRNMLDELPLYEIEYEGRRSVNSYVGKQNSGIEYIANIRPSIYEWCAKTVPNFDPDELATRVIAAAYGHFRILGKKALDKLRLEYAVHYHNNCVSSGNFRNAEKWREVIDELS